MKRIFRRVSMCVLPALLPLALMAFKEGPPPRRTGNTVDGLNPDGTGQSCAACHRDNGPANSDPTGKLTIEASDYAPGVVQTIRITLSHPTAQRWGFQLTARTVGDQTKMAGTFPPTDPAVDLYQVRCDASGTAIVTAPCGDGVLQFPEHTQQGTAAGKLGGNTWEIQWMPPAQDVGDVVLYAAGNAANFDNNLTGDHIFTTKLVIHAQNLCNLTQKPSIRNITSAASFEPNKLAPNCLFTIFGANFAAPGLTRSAGLGDFVEGKFPTALGCVAVEINGQRAPITYVQGDQINAQVPTGVAPGGPVTITVVANPGRPNETRSDVASGVNVLAVAPAFFTIGGKQIAATVGNGINGDPSTAGRVAAKPGDIITLYGTGCGQTDPTWQAGEIPDGQAKLATAPTITIGGTTLAAADILYAGLAPQLISGVCQYNVKIPASATAGDVPVSMTIAGQSSQPGTTIRVGQ